MKEKIRILVIYEILGRPPEHIKTTLEQLIETIGRNPGIKLIEKKVHEPHLLDEKKVKNLPLEDPNIFSTFAEVELEVDNLMLIFNLILNTLPSNIEIIEPEELQLKNFDASSLLSDLTIKLHRYDEVTKALLLEKNQLVNVIEEMDKTIRSLGGTSNVEIVKEQEEPRVTKKEGAGEKKKDKEKTEEKGKGKKKS